MSDSVDHATVVLNPILVCVIVAAAAIALQRFVPLPSLESTGARYIGAVVFCLGFPFGLPATRAMRKARTALNPRNATTTLITSGVFGYSRSPIYVAMLLNYTGIVTFFGSPWGLLFLPAVFLALDRLVVVPEERYLARIFPDTFPDYCRSVQR